MSNFEELWARGRHDPIFFAEQLLGVHSNPAQQRWLPKHVPDADGNWPYHRTVHISGNQVGKSLGLAILILWAASYKIGLSVRMEPRRWLETPYRWFHVAPDQATAYIPLDIIEALVKGAHPSQVSTCRFPADTVSFSMIETGYRGFTTMAGAVVQFRTTAEKAKALQGRVANVISFDEAGLENHLIEVMDTVLSMRLISTGGPLILVGTPDGMNDYYEVVQSILGQSHPSPDEERVWLGDDVALVWSHVSDNIGYGYTAEEASRKEAELDQLSPEKKAQMLQGAFLEPSEAFFVPGSEIEKAWDDSLPAYVEPQPGRRYVIFWDPSVSTDPTAGYVIDVTRKPFAVVQEVYQLKSPGFTWLLSRMREVHSDRNSVGKALTGYDSTSMGGKIFKESLSNIRPAKPLDFGGPKAKLDYLGNLKAMLLNGSLVIPGEMVGLKREVLNYRLDDKNIKQDRVMALAGAAWLAGKGFSGKQTASFSPSGRIAVPTWR